MAICKGCGASIWWNRTKNGKMIPCDITPIGFREVPGARGKIVTQDGRIVSCEFTDDPDAEKGFLPHFATCPNAADFKRRKAACSS